MSENAVTGPTGGIIAGETCAEPFCAELRLKLGIDDYSWRAWRELSEKSQDEILLFLTSLTPDFERHPERWGICFSMLSRDFRKAERFWTPFTSGQETK